MWHGGIITGIGIIIVGGHQINLRAGMIGGVIGVLLIGIIEMIGLHQGEEGVPIDSEIEISAQGGVGIVVQIDPRGITIEEGDILRLLLEGIDLLPIMEDIGGKLVGVVVDLGVHSIIAGVVESFVDRLPVTLIGIGIGTMIVLETLIGGIEVLDFGLMIGDMLVGTMICLDIHNNIIYLGFIYVKIRLFLKRNFKLIFKKRLFGFLISYFLVEWCVSL